jgi:hypothetical protein
MAKMTRRRRSYVRTPNAATARQVLDDGNFEAMIQVDDRPLTERVGAYDAVLT